MDSTFTPDIYDDIIRLVQNIPITNSEIDGDLDSRFSLSVDDLDVAHKIGHTEDYISLRDIIQLMIKFLNDENRLQAIMKQQYEILTSGVTYPPQYLLFDYCLASLGGDITDAMLYLDHAYKILNLSPSFHIMLGCLVNTDYLNDPDVRNLLAVLANTIEPVSASSHKNRYGNEYRNRFDVYERQLKTINQ